jgi:hypothetical protein
VRNSEAGYSSFTHLNPLRNLLVAQRSQPQTFTDNVWFNLECVFRAGFQETEEVLHDGGGGMVPIEVYETFAVDGGCVYESGFLRVVDEIAGIYT